jgi:hypothetical protein
LIRCNWIHYETEANAQPRMRIGDCRIGQRVIHETLGAGEVVDVKTRTVIVRLDLWPEFFALPSELREELPQTARKTVANDGGALAP